MSGLALRPYQQDAITAVEDALAARRRAAADRASDRVPVRRKSSRR